jgi:hypothetical protein
MIRNLRTFAFMTIILLISSITCSLASSQEENTPNQREKLISFNSYMDIYYDPTPLREPLEIELSVTIPIKIKYWTDIPSVFNKIPFPFNNLILFRKPIRPMQKIHIEILEAPDWANIYISTPDVISDIPIGEEVEVETNLVLSPWMEAPAVPYKIVLRASCETIHRLNGFSFEESVEFTPQFVPTISIVVENPIRTVSPHESVNFKITVENGGNKLTRVEPILKRASEKWTPTVNPTRHDIPPGEKDVFTFSLIAPYDFGWHDYVESFEIEFKSTIFPIREGSPYETESLFLVVQNYGFSVPGAELIVIVFLIVIAVIIIIGTIIKKEK